MSVSQSIILRDAVKTAIRYLRLLPRVPATAAVIEDLEDALTRAFAASSENVACATLYTPVGELLLQGLLRDQDLLLTTELDRRRADVLWQALAGDGLKLQFQMDDLPPSANLNTPGN